MKTVTLTPLKLLVIALVAGAAGALAMAFIGHDKPQAKSTPTTPKPALTVTTTQAQNQSLPITLTANGSVAAWQEAIVGAEANGLRLAHVWVNVGDSVKAGQVLAVFDSLSVQADVAQAQATLAEAQANAQEAAQTQARSQTLIDSGALSAQQIQQYATADKTAQARVQAARAALQTQTLRLQHAQVLAPDSGLISARSATVGAVVPAGTELFRLIRGGRLEWRAEVTAAELSRLKIGGSVQVLAANGAQITGKVRALAPSLDAQNRTALVYVDLPKAVASAPVLAGMFARGNFDLGSSTGLTLPQQALVLRDGFSYVFSLQPDQRVRQRKVQTGRRTADRVEITGGLSAQERVVLNGAGFLNDGDLVRVNDAERQNSDKNTSLAYESSSPTAIK